MALVSQDVVTVDTWDVAAAKVARKAVPNQGLQSIAVGMSGGSEHAWFKDRDAARARAERKALPPTESHQSAAMERVSA